METALGCLVILALPIVWLYNHFKTPLKTKIQQLDNQRPQTWGEPIGEQVCKQCQTVNEGSRHSCFSCGASLQVKAVEPVNKDEPGDYSTVEVGVIYFFGVFIICIIVIIVVQIFY